MSSPTFFDWSARGQGAETGLLLHRVGTAFVEAWRQAGRNMRAGQGVGGGSAPGAGISANDAVSRQFRMTVDEARNILNLGKATEGEQSELMTQLLENYDRMMKANEKTSHYIQSKIVRARERLEAEYPECVQYLTPATHLILIRRMLEAAKRSAEESSKQASGTSPS